MHPQISYLFGLLLCAECGNISNTNAKENNSARVQFLQDEWKKALKFRSTRKGTTPCQGIITHARHLSTSSLYQHPFTPQQTSVIAILDQQQGFRSRSCQLELSMALQQVEAIFLDMLKASDGIKYCYKSVHIISVVLSVWQDVRPAYFTINSFFQGGHASQSPI